MAAQLKALAYKFYNVLLRVESGLLVVLLSSMVGMAVIQIIMRNVFASGIIWADSFVRVAVLWMALMGAMVSSRSGRHIMIDVFVRTLSKNIRVMVKRLTDGFAAFVCFVVMYYSYLFVKMEYEDGGLAFANVPNWMCESIIPFAFLIIGLRYFFSAVLNVRHSS